MNLADHVGEQVELNGIAYDAHAGAIVEVEGVPVYLEGVEQWPPGAFGVATRGDRAIDTKSPYARANQRTRRLTWY